MDGEKKEIRISLSKIIFIITILLLIIVILGVWVYKLSNVKPNEAQNNVQESTSELETFKSNENIVLHGKYIIPVSDSIWSFFEDGSVIYSGLLNVSQGTYKTMEDNIIEVHYTKSKESDDLTGEEIIKDVDYYEYFIVKDNNVFWKNTDGEYVKLELDGNPINYFEDIN